MVRFTYTFALVAALSLGGLFTSSASAGNGFGGSSGMFSGSGGGGSGKKNFKFNGGGNGFNGNFNHKFNGNFNHHHNGFGGFGGGFNNFNHHHNGGKFIFIPGKGFVFVR